MKLGRYEVLMVPYKCCCFSARSAQGRIQGGAKIGHGGPLLQETSSSDRKATATNQMDSNDLDAYGKKCCYFWFHSEVKFLTHFWRLFGLSHFCVFQCNFYGFLCGKVFNLHLFCVISMFVSEKNAYIKDLNALRILMNFVWKEGGCALMHVYVWDYIVSLYYRTAKWMFTKLGRDEVLMVVYKYCCCFLARSVQGRIQGEAKIGHRGGASSTNFFRLEAYSNKPNA